MNNDGVLVLAGTPIGDIDDASPALSRELQAADIVAAEDTRRAHILMSRLGVGSDARVVSFFDGNESQRVPGLIDELQQGARVCLVTDAGMPSVSDPGYRLVAACVDAGIRVTCVPGPSAVLTALAVSGLPVDRFCFEGFLSRTAGPRRRRLTELATEQRTLVFFEAPHRLRDFLSDAAASMGDERPAVVCRELTKRHEEVVRGTLGELAAWAAGEVRGEITIVIAGHTVTEGGVEEAVELVVARERDGEKMSSAVAEVAASLGVNRKQLYQAVLDARRRDD